ncbi:FecCD family ABC transporter permease [Schumannella soli]|uniref:Iron chelate uptake ABC transporter family permease subunit n=1 Tax=Schumannella soli TaxID=2590779 RepID=A0A506XY10_9MICO|nr:iron chelate uptake ABC transporter family permease subunit [Schumannella soli]TPW77651.1 iron chelate uptake ABC transporter family permease subunit [Schumannella soli]
MSAATASSRRDADARPARRTGARLRTRRRAIILALAAVVVVGFVLAICLGRFQLTPLEVIQAISDRESFAHQVVVEWRMPRTIAALAFGAALAVSGAIFQTLSRNPLGSPDIIGFSTGSYTGALIVTIVLGGLVPVEFGALAGGLATALVVYALAFRRGIDGFRLIIVGIGVTGVLAAINVWIRLRAKAEVAMAASVWGAGSLSTVDWAHLVPAVVILALLGVAVVMLAPRLRQLELGDDSARAHGLRVEPSRLALVAVGVALTAVATAVTGPIAFISLAAPQIAARLTRGPGIPLAASALLGAALLLGADQLAQNALPGVPVGVVTVCVGGGYLIWLLIREARRR